MDSNTPSAAAAPRKSEEQEGYTVHLLSLDGTIATVRKKVEEDTTFELTVEMRDRKAARKLPAELARNIRSHEFARVVREVKAELLDRRGRGRRAR